MSQFYDCWTFYLLLSSLFQSISPMSVSTGEEKERWKTRWSRGEKWEMITRKRWANDWLEGEDEPTMARRKIIEDDKVKKKKTITKRRRNEIMKYVRITSVSYIRYINNNRWDLDVTMSAIWLLLHQFMLQCTPLNLIYERWVKTAYRAETIRCNTETNNHNRCILNKCVLQTVHIRIDRNVSTGIQNKTLVYSIASSPINNTK